MRMLANTIRYNSLTIVLCLLFIVCIVAQTFASWRQHNETLAAHGRPTIGYWDNLTTGTFLDSLAVNWQAALLQLASLVVLSAFLYQRGAPHSRDPLRTGHEQEQREVARRYNWLYRNSLSLALIVLFLISFALHIISGASAYNEQRALTGRPPVSTAEFLVSATFWSSTMETWQAEYLAILLYMLFSIVLRQQGSAESKPLEAGNESTGEANR